MSTFYFLFSILCLVNAGCRSKEAGSELRVEAIVQKLKVLIHHGNPEAQVLVLVMRFVALASIFAFIARFQCLYWKRWRLDLTTFLVLQ